MAVYRRRRSAGFAVIAHGYFRARAVEGGELPIDPIPGLDE